VTHTPQASLEAHMQLERTVHSLMTMMILPLILIMVMM